jgi:hypothetical protein
MAGQPDCRLLIFRTAGLAPNRSYQTIGLQQIPAARRELCIAEVEAPVNMPLDEPSRPDDIRWALRKRAVWSERNSSLFGLGNFLFFTLYPDPTHLPIRLFDANPHFPMLGSVPFHDLMPRANPVGCPVRAVPVTHSAPRTVRPRMAELFAALTTARRRRASHVAWRDRRTSRRKTQPSLNAQRCQFGMCRADVAGPELHGVAKQATRCAGAKTGKRSHIVEATRSLEDALRRENWL